MFKLLSNLVVSSYHEDWENTLTLNKRNHDIVQINVYQVEFFIKGELLIQCTFRGYTVRNIVSYKLIWYALRAPSPQGIRVLG